jgi:hypothetical protein
LLLLGKERGSIFWMDCTQQPKCTVAGSVLVFKISVSFALQSGSGNVSSRAKYDEGRECAAGVICRAPSFKMFIDE